MSYKPSEETLRIAAERYAQMSYFLPPARIPLITSRQQARLLKARQQINKLLDDARELQQARESRAAARQLKEQERARIKSENALQQAAKATQQKRISNYERQAIPIRVRIGMIKDQLAEASIRLYRADPFTSGGAYESYKARVQALGVQLASAQASLLALRIRPQQGLSVKDLAQRKVMRRVAMRKLQQTNPEAARRLLDAATRKYKQVTGGKKE